MNTKLVGHFLQGFKSLTGSFTDAGKMFCPQKFAIKTNPEDIYLRKELSVVFPKKRSGKVGFLFLVRSIALLFSHIAVRSVTKIDNNS